MFSLSRMKRVLAAIFVSGLMLAVVASPAFAFHHGFVPANECGQSNHAGGNNPTATAAITEHNTAQTLPLPPAGTPGANQGAGDEHCASAES